MKRKKMTPHIIGGLGLGFGRESEGRIRARVRDRRSVLISRDMGTWEAAAKKVSGIARKTRSSDRVRTIRLTRFRRRGSVDEAHSRTFIRKGSSVREKPGSFKRARRL